MGWPQGLGTFGSFRRSEDEEESDAGKAQQQSIRPPTATAETFRLPDGQMSPKDSSRSTRPAPALGFATPGRPRVSLAMAD